MKCTCVSGSTLPWRRLFLGILVVVGLIGCATTKIEGGAGSWTPATLGPGDVVPQTTNLSRRTKIVVIPSAESPTARGAGLAEMATVTLQAILGSGGVEVVDRKLAGRLDDELRLTEARGTGTYGGPDVADYAIRIVMGTAGSSTSYTEPSTYTDRKTKKTEQVPGGYTHSGISNMTLRIYALPSLKLVDSVPIQGTVGTGLQQNATGNAIALMRGATEAGIKGKRSVLLNEFAPKGYITEKRVKEKLAIFRVQLGKNTGAKTGDVLEIWTLQKVGDSFDEVSIGSGRVSNIVGAEGSWMVVDDEKIAGRVRKYDYVKVKLSTGFFN